MGGTPARRSVSRRARPGTEVIVHDRADQAHRLRLAGLGWPDVAERVGYLDGRVTATAVNAFLQKVALEQAPDQQRRALELELARLDQIQAAFYPPRYINPRPSSSGRLSAEKNCRCTSALPIGDQLPKSTMARSSGNWSMRGSPVDSLPCRNVPVR